MAKQVTTLQPGPVFYAAFAGAMKALDLSLKDWAEARGYFPINVKAMAVGATNGPKSRKARQEMIETVGEDLFRALYEARLKSEEAQ